MIGKTNSTQKSNYSSEFVNLQLFTNQAEHSNLDGSILTMSYETYVKQYIWDGKEITFSVPAHVSCTIEFPEVEGYKKPDNITFVAVEGNSRTIEAEYKAELVKVNVTSSNGSAVSGATLTINGKQQTWNGTEIRQLVPFGTQYSVVAGDVDGFGTPSTQTFTAQNPEREVSVVYIASSLKVNILSNQGTDAAIADVKATVKYGSTSVEVANGGTVNLPTNTSVTISFPEVADYKKPADITYTHTGGLVEKSGTYQCELLTVNVTADSGSVSGFEVTISKQETVGVATKYTRLEYIESNGSQYIDTGFKPNQDTRLVMDFDIQSQDSYPKAIFGGRDHNTSRVDSFVFWTISNSAFRSEYGTENKTVSITPVGRFVVDKNKNTVSVNGSITSHSSATFQSENNLALFSILRPDGVDSRMASMKLYSCQVYDNGTLIRDYIPALRSDGIAGLYDSVNDTFSASSGSANFIAGGEASEVFVTQTSVTGSYKIPFDTSYTLEASKVGGYNKPSAITRIASQKNYTANMQYAVITEIDLSLQDVYGNPINRSTSNCYVIRETGTYKFPLVYGNAIKNGQVNTAAFTNNGGSNSHDFYDGYGDVISKAYISGDYEMSWLSASISNTDENNAVSNISVIESNGQYYIRFDVVKVPSVGANIVLSLAHPDIIIWSWHIWLWPHDLSPVEITNSTGVKYKIMPTNLASKYDADGVHIKNWFYQWGRPNPMLLPSAWNSATDHSPGSIIKEGKANHISWAHQEPTTFYYNSASPYNWFGDKSYYNLWDAACTGTGNSDNDTVKTVYDPCPVGWKVPNGNTFTGLSILSSSNGIVKMSRYSGDTVGVEFPLSGFRDSNNGLIAHINTAVHVWLSSASSNENACELYIISDRTFPNAGMRRASGLSVRPVEDDLTKIDTI